MKYPLSEPEKRKIHDFLDGFKFSQGEYESSYRFWLKGGRGWHRTIATGGTYIMKALMWYQHHYKPGSSEYRPRVIVNALCVQAGLSSALSR